MSARTRSSAIGPGLEYASRPASSTGSRLLSCRPVQETWHALRAPLAQCGTLAPTVDAVLSLVKAVHRSANDTYGTDPSLNASVKLIVVIK